MRRIASDGSATCVAAVARLFAQASARRPAELARRGIDRRGRVHDVLAPIRDDEDGDQSFVPDLEDDDVVVDPRVAITSLHAIAVTELATCEIEAIVSHLQN